MIYKQIQHENKEWADHNFGPHTSENPALGVLEEIGELSHAILKARQKIRDADKQLELIMDACADAVIFLADYCNCTGMHLVPLAEEDKEPRIESLLATCAAQIAALLHGIGQQENVSCLLTALEAIADRYGFILERQVMTTWRDVSLRDWKKYPKNGRTE